MNSWPLQFKTFQYGIHGATIESECARPVFEWSVSWVILPLGVSFELRPVEVNLAQVARGVPLRLIVEVRRPRMPALPARGDRPRPHRGTEFHDGDEAVSAGSIPLLRARIRSRPERRQRTPRCRREADRNARRGVV